MADNRIYLYCPICKEVYNIGKVLYNTNIYLQVSTEKEIAKYHEDTYRWMSKHFSKCYGDRFYKGKLFEVRTEYDKKVQDKL